MCYYVFLVFDCNSMCTHLCDDTIVCWGQSLGFKNVYIWVQIFKKNYLLDTWQIGKSNKKRTLLFFLIRKCFQLNKSSRLIFLAKDKEMPALQKYVRLVGLVSLRMNQCIHHISIFYLFKEYKFIMIDFQMFFLKKSKFYEGKKLR